MEALRREVDDYQIRLQETKAGMRDLESLVLQQKELLEVARKRLADAEQEIAAQNLEENSLETLLSLASKCIALEAEEEELRSGCKVKRKEILSQIRKMQEKSVKEEGGAEEGGEGMASNGVEAEQKSRLMKKELASLFRQIVHATRRIEEFPNHSELLQFERRFRELSSQIQLKDLETHRLFSSHNLLTERLKLIAKESSLLTSIHSQVDKAIATSSGRASLVKSVGAIAKSVKEMRGKMDSKLHAAIRQREKVVEEVEEMKKAEEEYATLIKKLQDEADRNVWLRAAKAEQRKNGNSC